MKGIILSEFVEFLEDQFGFEVAQKVIDSSGVSSKGAYSRVGRYDYQELIQLLTHAVEQTDTDVDDLTQPFADHLFTVFKRDYSVFFEGVSSAAQMLTRIDGHIHVEVKKLYPDAELPKFEYQETEDVLILNYKSPRPLADVAKALVSACLKYFENRESLTQYSIDEDRCGAQFIIEKASN